jgi:hypothetical protein
MDLAGWSRMVSQREETDVIAAEVVMFQEIVVTTVRMTQEGRERRDRLTAEGKCLACERKLGDDEDRKVGQCLTCYQATRRAERAGIKKRRDLIRDGLALPNDQPGPKPSNPYTQHLSETHK